MKFVKIDDFIVRRFRTVHLPYAYLVLLSDAEKRFLWFDVNIAVHRPLKTDIYGEGDEHGRALLIGKTNWITSHYESGMSLVLHDKNIAAKNMQNTVLKTIKWLQRHRNLSKSAMELSLRVPLRLNDELYKD